MVEDSNDSPTLDELDSFDDWEPLARTADRDRGILTAHDRKYLLGDVKLNGQDERNARYRIRQRTIQALLDISLLVDFLDVEDRKQIVDDERVTTEEVNAVAALAYDLLYRRDDIPKPIEAFEEMVGSAVLSPLPPSETPEEKATIRNASVDIEITEENVPIEEEALRSRLTEFLPEDVAAAEARRMVERRTIEDTESLNQNE